MTAGEIKNLMITSWMITISVAIVLSVALQNITIIKVVSVVLGLGFAITPFKDGLEFILLKKNNACWIIFGYFNHHAEVFVKKKGNSNGRHSKREKDYKDNMGDDNSHCIHCQLFTTKRRNIDQRQFSSWVGSIVVSMFKSVYSYVL